MRNELFFVLAATALVLLARLVPHPENFAPTGGLALFCGAFFRSRFALFVPAVATLLVDIATGAFAGVVMLGVYFGFYVQAAIGRGFLRERIAWLRGIGAVGFGAIAFYALSNLGMWWYAWPQTAAGLFACYLEGLPFLFRSLLADALFGSALIFGWAYVAKLAATMEGAGIGHAR